MYYTQLAHRNKTGKYMTAAADLGLKDSPLGLPALETTRSGFEASLTAPKANGGKKWTITHDARIWSE